MMALLLLSLVCNLIGCIELVDAQRDRTELFEAVVACEVRK